MLLSQCWGDKRLPLSKFAQPQALEAAAPKSKTEPTRQQSGGVL